MPLCCARCQARRAHADRLDRVGTARMKFCPRGKTVQRAFAHPTALVAAFALLLLSPAPSHAAYPDKAVRIIVPVAAGGGVDVMARLLAQKLSERLGQQFIVENRAGAAGIIGTKAVIAAPADGATLLYTPSSLSLTVAVNKVPPYDVA